MVSRLYKYWQNADWANLRSWPSAEVLTGELVSRIVAVCASFPWWGPAEVRQHLCAQGIPVSLAQVEQAVVQSGWAKLRQTLFERYDLTGAALQLRDDWLVGQFFDKPATQRPVIGFDLTVGGRVAGFGVDAANA